MERKNILFIIGSLRSHSLNRQLAERIMMLLDDRAGVSVLDYTEIPYMNQDLEFPPPGEISRIRQEVLAADGLWIVTPEYNYSYPGLLKNLLDWLSRPIDPSGGSMVSVLTGKKVTISGVGGKRATEGARMKLMELLEFVQMDPLKTVMTGISQPAEAFLNHTLILSDEDIGRLGWQVDAFLEKLG